MPSQPAQAAGSICVSGHCEIMAPHAVPNQKSKQKHSFGIAIYLVWKLTPMGQIYLVICNFILCQN